METATFTLPKSIKRWVYEKIREQLLKYANVRNIAFTTIVNSNYVVGVAVGGDKGYIDTGIVIPELLYDDAKQIVNALNEDLLQIDLLASMKIVASTM